jgi:hypothetical protein
MFSCYWTDGQRAQFHEADPRQAGVGGMIVIAERFGDR